jgi:parallel beta-helix repeat protein
MKNVSRFLGLILVSALTALAAHAATLYVWLASPSPGGPYAGWSTAAHTIQDAVDFASPGDSVLVTNGLYATGWRAVGTNLLPARVVIDKPISVLGVSGPAGSVIQGRPDPATTNGDAAIRCVYLASGASLAGFTLTSGATLSWGDTNSDQSGGAVWCASTNVAISNCVLTGNSAMQKGGGAYRGTLYNCTLIGNRAGRGGGAFLSTLRNCILTGNSAGDGGGVYDTTLFACTLAGNTASNEGGGAYASTTHDSILAGNSARHGGAIALSTLYNSIITGNSAELGGGTYACAPNNCSLTGNSASDSGGGAVGGTLTKCTITGNRAGGSGGGTESTILHGCILTGNLATSGGGAVHAYLDNCAIVDNFAWDLGGGVAASFLVVNCIVAYNTAWTGPNHADSTLDHCCTTPLPGEGDGNISLPPLFVDLAGGNLRLQSNSPCINAGRNSYLTVGTDLDGHARVVRGTVDIGAYEYQTPASSISYAWLQGYGLPTDGSADFTDPDGDLFNTWQEWTADTDPINPASCLRLESIASSPSASITFPSSASRLYTLLRSTNLNVPTPPGPAWTSVPGQSDVRGTGTLLTLADPNPPFPAFYRVAVRQP